MGAGRGRVLTLSGYREAGGVKGAIAKTAEGVSTKPCPRPSKPSPSAIFLRLTELGDAGHPQAGGRGSCARMG